MLTFNETGPGVPAFLAKLWRLVEDSETNDLISWSTDGRSFIIQNQAQFAKELLPLNYKHNNMASFIRQLNMYGFHKITSIDNGGLRFDRDEMEFTHPCFQKDHPYLLEHIKRKIATSKQQQQLQAQQQAEDKSSLKLEAVSRVLNEVKHMRGRQDSLDTRFQTMKQENEALWREIAILRQKHHKQQQIVNKLIQFLVTIVQPSRGGLGSMSNGSNKRRFQLMINDAPQQAKLKKSDFTESATIEELGEALEEVAYANQQELLSKQDKTKKNVIPIVTSQIVRTTQSSDDARANTSSSSTSAVAGKSTKARNIVGSSGSSFIRKQDGSRNDKKERAQPGGQTKATRNSELSEVSSPMSIPDRSPYHRTPTPSGGNSSRSSNSSSSGGRTRGLVYADGSENVDEILSTSPVSVRSGASGSGLRGSGTLKHGNNAADLQQSYGVRSKNAKSTPANLIQLIESTVKGDDSDNYDEGDEDDNDSMEHGYLVDHVDEIDPTFEQFYHENDSEMMLNTPMVIKEMEKEQHQQQQQKQRPQRYNTQQLIGKGGESLLKGSGSNNKRNAEVQQQPSSQRSQRSLLSTPTATNAPNTLKASGSGLGLSTAGSTAAPSIITRGGKKLALAKKQTPPMNHQQQSDVASPGPSGFNGTIGQALNDQQVGGRSIALSSPVTTSGLSFVADNGYMPVNDVVPGDIFDDSNDQGNAATKNANNPSPMLSSSAFNIVDGGYYNPNVNINEIKNSRQQQMQTQQNNVAQQQQNQSPGMNRMGEGAEEDYDENSLDSALLLNQATGNADQQQLSKFVSNDLDVSRLSTVAEYGQHIDTVQNDLESLKELLKGDGYQLDANALLGNSCTTAPTHGRVYFPSCPFDSDIINKVRTDLFNNNEDMLGYDFPMNLPDLMTDDQQQLQQQLLQQQNQQQHNSNNSDKSDTSGSPTPVGHISPVPSAHTQLTTYKLQGGGYGAGNGIHGVYSAGNMCSNGNGNINGGLLGGGNGVIGPDGSLGIVSGDYIDLNELLNMEANCGDNSLKA
ncbi:uncharacterized protein LOC128720863 [Anopheles nili]|uniref:uncharacterized protein LOC128720863 n=1 Tax=Anopheles nili TaxID=185578 RepID=UPI00237BD0F9|nr:uncharacterized protein LOC128720863 [Anopheles nili]